MPRKKWSLVLYLLAVHALLAVVLIKSDFIDRVLHKIGVPGEELGPYYQTLTRFHKTVDSALPPGATLFVGDSITQGLAVLAVTDKAANFGIGLDTTAGVIARMPSYESLDRARAVVIAIGSNDLQRRDNASIINNYTAIFDQLPAHLPTVVSAILPVDERVAEVTRSNRRIKKVNTALRELVQRYPQIKFVDASEELIDESGNLGTAHHQGDGIHPSDSGYRIWIDHLRAALRSIEG